MLGELEIEGRVVVSDLEAGLGTLLRVQPGHVDVVLVVANPSAKSIEVARRALAIAAARGARPVLVANRVRDDDDLAAIRAVTGGHETVVVPEDPIVEAADRDGRAPIDVDRDAPAVRALAALARRLADGG